METIVANLTGKTRRETIDGREYIVAPVSMIVADRVLNGSQGSLFYPSAEVAAHPGMWNGMPITNGHPFDANGNVSARSPKIKSKFEIGTVYNDRFENGKRIADGWFDVKLTQRKAPAVYAALNAGTPMELSTGLFTENEAVANGKAPNGASYQFVAKNYKPDHLAILPTQKGACSLKDGCGLLIGNATCECQTGKEIDVTSNEDKKSLWARLGQLFGITDNVMDDGAGQGCDVVDGKSIKIKGKGKGRLPTLDQSKKEVEKGIKDTTANSSNEGEPMTRDKTIQFLTTNCSCWKGKADVLANEDAFSDEDLTALKTSVENAAKNALTVNALAEAVGDEMKDVTANDMPAFIKKKIAAKKGDAADGDADDDGDDEDVADKKDKKVTKNEESTPMDIAAFERMIAASPEAAAVWNTAKLVEQQERKRLVGQLVANVRDASKRTAMTKRFMDPKRTTLDDLNEMIELLPPVRPTTTNRAAPKPISFFGSQDAVPTDNAEDTADDILDVPVLNFGKGAA